VTFAVPKVIGNWCHVIGYISLIVLSVFRCNYVSNLYLFKILVLSFICWKIKGVTWLWICTPFQGNLLWHKLILTVTKRIGGFAIMHFIRDWHCHWHRPVPNLYFLALLIWKIGVREVQSLTRNLAIVSAIVLKCGIA